MKRYLIERELPGVGSMNGQELAQAAVKSNSALPAMNGKAQWIHSYVADGGLCAGIRNVISSIMHQRRRRSLEYDLERMDDYVLRDIGLHESEIKRAVYLRPEFWSDAAARTGS
jgi:uncharacterized protein YjiS (DUF1127 family)